MSRYVKNDDTEQCRATGNLEKQTSPLLFLRALEVEWIGEANEVDWIRVDCSV